MPKNANYKSHLKIHLWQHVKQESIQDHPIIPATAGGVSSSVARALTQPLDVIKIRFQLQVEPLGGLQSKSKYRGVLQAFRLIYREESLIAFWNGHVPGQLLSCFFGISQFWAYESFFNYGNNVPILKDSPNLLSFVSGGFGGGLATIITAPIDTVKTRLIAQDQEANLKKKFNARRVFWQILAEDGPKGLYRGLNSGLFEIMPFMGFNFMFYGLFRDGAFLLVPNISEKEDLPTSWLLFFGALSGSLSKTIVYPFDLMKKRLQIQGFEENRKSYGKTFQCLGLIDCCKLMARTEGFRGFYKGVIPTMIKASIMTSINFCLYDKITMLLREANF